MIQVRIYCGDDGVDFNLPTKDDFIALQNFINRQENMQIFIIY